MTRLILLLLLAGCTASPVPTLYTLAAEPGVPMTTPRISLELRRIGLAGYLDRPEIVRGTVQYRLQVAEQDRWGEPLGRMLDRVLTEDLVTRLPEAAVFAESGAISTRPDMVLEIDIQRLDADAEGALVLLAQIALRPEGGTASAETLRLRVALPAKASARDHVAAMSAALGHLADAVARKISK